MASTEFSALVGKLRGSAISCLMLMIGAPGPLDMETLQFQSGYCRHTFNQGMKKLLYCGLIECCDDEDGYGTMWQLSQKALDLIKVFPARDAAPDEPISEPTNPSAMVPGDAEPGTQGLSPAAKKIFLLSSSSSSSLYNPEIKKTKKLRLPTTTTTTLPEKTAKTPEKPPGTNPDTAVINHLREAYRLLRQSGMGGMAALAVIRAVLKTNWDGADRLSSEPGETLRLGFARAP